MTTATTEQAVEVDIIGLCNNWNHISNPVRTLNPYYKHSIGYTLLQVMVKLQTAKQSYP